MRCDASNQWTEQGVDLGAAGTLDDACDLAFSEEDAFEVIESGIGKLLAEGRRPVSLGGDHSITYPIVKAFARKHPDLTIFHFDAHPDFMTSSKETGCRMHARLRESWSPDWQNGWCR
jgi:arginase family enzyme